MQVFVKCDVETGGFLFEPRLTSKTWLLVILGQPQALAELCPH